MDVNNRFIALIGSHQFMVFNLKKPEKHGFQYFYSKAKQKEKIHDVYIQSSSAKSFLCYIASSASKSKKLKIFNMEIAKRKDKKEKGVERYLPKKIKKKNKLDQQSARSVNEDDDENENEKTKKGNQINLNYF